MNNKANIKEYSNKVFLKDILELLKELPNNSVDVIYGDPDYNVGIKYGDKTYTKTFDEYIEWYIKLAKESLRVLKDTGNMFLINYPKQNSYLRVKYLDKVCYEVSDYVWVYNTNVGHSPKRFTTAHRNILHCRKTKDNNFYKENVAVPYQNPTDKRILGNIANGSKGRMPYSWFYYNLVKNVSKEKTFHSCQIPQKLSEMLIKSCTLEGDIVLILFGGSGSEIEVCKILKRQYISAEIDEKYHKMIMERLNKGKIEERYKLRSKKYNTEDISLQLTLLEEQGIYSTNRRK
ncbi:MAG: site-specific DNA-methyltransferase [Candidatus Sumerlaeota bacterium]|nr:site-specific DNA-methyltransferase [Candidatus Sumerlaeota bacterium]